MPALQTEHPGENLQALRHLIRDLAPRCGFNLDDRNSIREFLDNRNNYAECLYPWLCAELRAMLILLFRLEASTSEDLGFHGMRKLWHQHDETLARFVEINLH